MHTRENLQDESGIEIRFKACFGSNIKWEPDTGFIPNGNEILCNSDKELFSTFQISYLLQSQN